MTETAAARQDAGSRGGPWLAVYSHNSFTRSLQIRHSGGEPRVDTAPRCQCPASLRSADSGRCCSPCGDARYPRAVRPGCSPSAWSLSAATTRSQRPPPRRSGCGPRGRGIYKNAFHPIVPKGEAMDADDFLENEVGTAVAATAVLLSPRARAIVRRGVVYGAAGVIKVTDVVIGAAWGAARGLTDGAARGAADGRAARASAGRSSAAAPRRSSSSASRSRRPSAKPRSGNSRAGTSRSASAGRSAASTGRGSS